MDVRPPVHHDTLRDQMERENSSVDQDIDDGMADAYLSPLMVFSACKYQEAKEFGPRLPGVRHDDLADAAKQLLAAYKQAWRAGFKVQHLIREAARQVGLERKK